MATRDNTGTGGVLYVAEYNGAGSSIGVVNIASNGTLCRLTNPGLPGAGSAESRVCCRSRPIPRDSFEHRRIA